MSTQAGRNIVIVVGVVAVVGAFATFKESARTSAPEATTGTRTPGASVTHATLPASAPGIASTAAAKMPRMVDLGADKCIPCKKMAPILAELKTEYAGKAVVEFIDVWKNPKAGEPYDIRIIPTQVFFDRDGKEVWRHEGFLPKDEIVAKLRSLGAG